MSLALAIVAVFVAAFVMACAGFGFGMVAVPFLLFLMPHQEVVAVVIILSGCISAYVAWDARRHIRPRLLLPLAAGGVVGIPMGVWVLKHIDPTLYKAGAGAIIALLALMLVLGWRKPVARQHLVLFPLGIVSGIMGGSMTIGGPPIILFLTSQGTQKEVFRANLITYFFIMNCWGAVVLTASGLFTRPVFVSAGLLALPMLIGAYLGARMAHRVPEQSFRQAVLWLVFVLGLLLCAANVWKSIT